MVDILNFTGKGLFEMDKDKIIHYEELIYELCEEAISNMGTIAPKEISTRKFIHNLQTMIEQFNEEEDYEMSYLINHAIKKMKEKYGV